MLQITAPTQIDRAVSALAAWLETMRGPGGYGGPVAHWWQQSLIYTGAALDWRYEGIIAGYVLLWQRTGKDCWLLQARRAGDDLVRGQQLDGHYPASAFEINPATAGTPHEAACDVGLLLLAQALQKAGHDGWQRYAATAERNLSKFYVEQMWNETTQSFNDSPRVSSFVPNKAATASEAMFLLAEISGDDVWAERYAIPNLDRILAHQVRDGGRLDGAIAQNSFGRQLVDKYFPIYIARCVPVLLRGYRWTGDERYLDGALRAMQFIARWIDADGSCATVVYANGRANRAPSWIAPLGDVLRAADEARPLGFDADLSAVRQRLLAGQDASGGIQTATGFAAQAGGRAPKIPDVRDVLHVAGWCDKAFRYLAAHAGAQLPETGGTFEIDCVFQGATLHLTETIEQLEIRDRRGVCYRWRKGEAWPEIASPLFWLR
ncbi:MAG TPA: hypothetical protein VGD69_04020 [Herpetosiphonaceae bacterium]